MRSKRKNAVLLTRVPDEFRPSAIGDIPGVVLSGHLSALNLTFCQAVEHVRRHNTQRLAAGGPVREWALLVKWIKPLESKGGAA